MGHQDPETEDIAPNIVSTKIQLTRHHPITITTVHAFDNLCGKQLTEISLAKQPPPYHAPPHHLSIQTAVTHSSFDLQRDAQGHGQTTAREASPDDSKNDAETLWFYDTLRDWLLYFLNHFVQLPVIEKSTNRAKTENIETEQTYAKECANCECLINDKVRLSLFQFCGSQKNKIF